MKQNMGTADRILRVVLAVVVAALYFTDSISGTVALILGLFAIIFLATSAMAYCPLYLPLKLSTKKKDA